MCAAHHRPEGQRDEVRRVRRRDGQGFHIAHEEIILTPSQGARLTFAEIAQAAAQHAPPETHVPSISRAILNPEGLQILDQNDVPVVPNVAPDMIPPIHLINQDEEAGPGGYAFVRKLCNLRHAPGWGELWSGIMYTRIRPGVFRAPPPGKFVAIKKLSKRVMHRYLRAGNNHIPMQDLRHVDQDYIQTLLSVRDRENPYREMSRMDEIGDNIHVLGQIEFLQDDDYCYIIMQHASGRRSLDTALFHHHQRELTPNDARNFFVQILRILAYLEEKGIHHRDLSPDNFIFLDQDRLVVMDLAMSVRIPVDPATGRRTLIRALGRFGTPAFMSPEIWNNMEFDGVAADLWSAMLILYAMLTNVPLYRQPDAQADISFRYYILARAITQDPMNELVQEILGDVFDEDEPEQQYQHILLTQAQAHLGLIPHANDLFHNFFLIDPAQRFTLAQVMESDYVRFQED